LSLTKVGNVTEIVESKEYTIPITDLSGKLWNLSVCEMNEVTSDVDSIKLDSLSALFPEYNVCDLNRPCGKVDILIGSDYCTIFPLVISQVGKMQLMKNQFGYCCRGSHENIKFETTSKKMKANIHLLSGEVLFVDKIGISQEDGLKRALDQFYSLDGLGIQFTPQCGGCKCGRCPIGSKKCSIEEERGLRLIEDGLSYDAEKKRWTATYPLQRNSEELPNNLSSVIQRLKSLE
jgi:hypothetical protein